MGTLCMCLCVGGEWGDFVYTKATRIRIFRIRDLLWIGVLFILLFICLEVPVELINLLFFWFEVDNGAFGLLVCKSACIHRVSKVLTG